MDCDGRLSAYSCGGSPGFRPEFPFHLLSENLSLKRYSGRARWASTQELLVVTTLVLGGARSGKTAYAVRKAEAEQGALVYVATAEPLDAEMEERIRRHKAERGARWRTVETPLDLPGTLEAISETETAVVDCLTLWLSNLMHADRDIDYEAARMIRALPGVNVIFVSNEVGLGIVPDNALARRFRDAAGRLNQAVAAAADNVIFVAAGLPLQMKG